MKGIIIVQIQKILQKLNKQLCKGNISMKISIPSAALGRAYAKGKVGEKLSMLENDAALCRRAAINLVSCGSS